MIGIASESASLRPADKMSHSGVPFRKISGKLRHFHVTCIAEDESSATVKHAQARGHVVERDPCRLVLPTFLGWQ